MKESAAAGAPPGTATQILDVAEQLVQTRGYNGFSYADIAERLGIKKASLHYHFRTKADLGTHLIVRYTEAFMGALEAITSSGEPAPGQLRRYARLYSEVVRGERMCLCGMLAAEYSSLPDAMQDDIRRFFDLNEAWLAGVIEAGRTAGTLRAEGSAQDAARTFLAALEGAMLVARPYADPDRFDESAKRLLRDITVLVP